MNMQRKRAIVFVGCQTISFLCSAIAIVCALYYVLWFFTNAAFATPYQIGRAACSVIIPVGVIAFVNHFLPTKNRWRKFWLGKTVVFLFGYYALISLCFLFFGGRSEYDYSHAAPNLSLFSRIRLSYEMHTLSLTLPETILDYINNVALFFPFGVFVPMVFPCLRRISTFLCVSILIIVLVEVLQQLSHVGYFDVDDCVFNFIGSFFGYLAYKAYYFIYTIIKKGKRSKAVI